jgi:hypothetical protein
VLTRQQLKRRLEEHVEGKITLEDLSAWAEEVFRTEAFEPAHQDQMEEILSVLRDATDPHRFRWEQPDFELMLEQLDP